MGVNKAVHLMFLCGGLLLFFMLNWTGEWIAGYFVRNPSQVLLNGGAAVLAVVIGLIVYRSDRVFNAAGDVAEELSKVTWPTKKETQAATIVVIVMVLVSALIMGLFDLMWLALTRLVYGS